MYCVDVVALRKAFIDKGANTIGEMSTVSGVDRNTLSNILNGSSYPSSTTMVKIVNSLDMEGAVAGSIFFAKILTDSVKGEEE